MPNKYHIDLPEFSKEYSLTQKKVKIEGRQFDAEFVKDHSRVEGIVLEVRDLNAHDSYANIPDWSTTCFVRYKGDKTWKNFYHGKQTKFEVGGTWYDTSRGLFRFLFNLESEKTIETFLTREKINFLRKDIKGRKKLLEELTRKK